MLRPATAGGRVAPRWVAADLLVLSGAAILGAALSLTALRTLSLQPGLFPVFVIGAVLAALLVSRPQWIVPSLVGLILLFSGRESIGGLPSVIIVGGVVLLGYSLWNVVNRIKVAREVVIVFALLALSLIGTSLISPDGASFPLDTLKNLVFLILVALALRSVADVDRAVTSLVVVAVFLGLGALYTVLAHPTLLFPLEKPEFTGQEITLTRVSGPFGDPNFFGQVLASLMPLAMYLVAKGGRHQYLGLAGIMSLIGGILATGSRGTLVALGFSLVAVAIFMPVARVRVVAALVVAAGLIAIPLFAGQTQEAEHRDVGGRKTAALVAVAMFEDHPLVGVGPGRFEDHFRDYSRLIGNEERLKLESHSLPLEIASEQGLVGILAWFTAGAVMLTFALRRGAWNWLLGRAILFSIATYLVAGLFLHGSLLKVLWILVGLCFAFAGALPERSRRLGLQ
jgi:putative inorganic carbon (HCO3(-)) transporter